MAFRMQGFEAKRKRKTLKDAILNALQNGYLRFFFFTFKNQNIDFLKINTYKIKNIEDIKKQYIV